MEQVKQTLLSWADVDAHLLSCFTFARFVLYCQSEKEQKEVLRQMGYRFVNTFGSDPTKNLIFCKELHRQLSGGER